MIKVTAGQTIYEVKEGTTLAEFAKRLQKQEEPVILLAYMDGKLTELFKQPPPYRTQPTPYNNWSLCLAR